MTTFAITPGLIIAFVWVFAEGTLFFIVPDLLLALTALISIKRACLQAAAVTVGALLAGTLMFTRSVHDTSAASRCCCQRATRQTRNGYHSSNSLREARNQCIIKRAAKWNSILIRVS
ncbi:hypothetical protein N9Z14_05535 [Opitutales bacterium]|nr:hypothetical protein [Opitutales bacterium]